MPKLQPFLISEFKTGFFTYLQPWIRPKDAFEPLINAYAYRGVLTKRNGYTVFGNQLADQNPVMGIMTRIDESTGQTNLVVISTKAAYLYNEGANTFNPLTAVGGSNSIFWMGTATGTIVMPTFWPNIVPASVTITDGTNNLTFNAAGAMNSPVVGIFAAGSTFNFTTGVATINFTGSTSNVSLKITATLVTPTTLVGGYFTGNNTNFFNWTNWQPTDPTTFVSSVSYLYMTNNVDPITLFDGTSLSRPIFYVDSAHADYIETTLDVQVYQNRLQAIKPTLNSTTNALNQSIYYSALFNPFNFINDVVGNGGQVTAATGDIIQAVEFLRNDLIVFFNNSVWKYRFTGNFQDPYRFDKLSASKSVNAPYGSVSYDERCTALGGRGLVSCDGSTIERYDIPIIEFYENIISQQFYSQTFAQRYDNLSQTWMLFVSNGQKPSGGLAAPGSDKALVYNFVENNWATYEFDVPMTCLGTFRITSDLTWQQLTQTWESADFSWSSYATQKLAPSLLAGDLNGNVYYMDNPKSPTDNGEPINTTITTTRWNPVLDGAQKNQFAYIDFYYTLQEEANPPVLSLSFFANNSQNSAITKTLTLDGQVNSEFNFKRVYVNLVGEFVQMTIENSGDTSFKILGMILWVNPAGRLTQGLTV